MYLALCSVVRNAEVRNTKLDSYSVGPMAPRSYLLPPPLYLQQRPK